MKNMTFYSYSFGCRVNEAEKEEIDRKMISLGYNFNDVNSDIIIVNSCSVTNKAQREARQYIFQMKKKHPNAKIVVTGCAATYWLKNSQTKAVPADLIVDNINKEYLTEIIKKRFSQQSGFHPGDGTGTTNKFIGSGRVMIKIQDGCQRFCTFCIVPYLRGMPQSEKIKNLKLKIKQYEGKVSEVILTAINTQAFGYDTGEKFVDLLKAVIDNTNIPRISLGSVHPWSLDTSFFEFYERYKNKKRLVNFFHVPLQSGSNKMLNLMKRGYTKEEMLDKLEKLRGLNENTLLATDIIVGFLEETDADFKETYDFLEKSPIDKFHVFRFSKRSKTAADYMAKRLTEPSSKEKEARALALIELSRQKLNKFMAKNVGRTTKALFLEKVVRGFQEALLDNQLPIYVDVKGRKPAFGMEEVRAKIRDVEIVDFKKGQLFGKIV